jgi:hypothetical protein
MPSDILNENQRRHYQVLLSMLSQSAGRVELLAASPPASESAFARYDHDLPPNFAARIAPHLRALREVLSRLARQLHIEPKRVSLRNSVRALLVTEIVRIEDSLATGLRGYGQVDSRVREQLDPLLQELMRELHAMKAVLEERHA